MIPNVALSDALAFLSLRSYRVVLGMALARLGHDVQEVLLGKLCDPLYPRVALEFSMISHELWELSQALREQLRTDHEVAAALCRKLGLRGCKELREATFVDWVNKGVFVTEATDLATLGKLGSVLSALKHLEICDVSGAAIHTASDGAQRLAEGLGTGALPAVISLGFEWIHVGDAGASALAAALGRGALPRLEVLFLWNTDIGDVGLVALAPALRRLPALEELHLMFNPFGDEGLVALVAPPPPAGAPPPPAGALSPPTGELPTARSPSASSPARFSSGLERLPCEFCQIPQPLARLTRHQQACPQRGGAPSQHAPLQRVPPIGELTKLKLLQLNCTKVTDAGCAILASAVDNGALPALRIGELFLFGTPGEAAAKTFRSKAFYRVLAK